MRTTSTFTKARWLAVVIGLLWFQVTYLFIPGGDDISLFPTGMLLFCSFMSANGLVAFGMFTGSKDDTRGPLVLGTLGIGLMLFLARAEHLASPNWALAVGVVAVLVLLAVLRVFAARR